MAASKDQVGFECEFVDDPLQWLQTECPICLQVLREPYQVTCCGKSFCRQCIERIKGNHKPCPCCKQDNFNDFPNKGLQQPLYGFKIYCANKTDGCEWTGELCQLESHLNLNQLCSGERGSQLEGCKFAEIKCGYCSKFLMRTALLNHKVNQCDKRPFSCEYCNNYESTYEDVTQNHWPTCVCHPVQCPNQCGAHLQRQDIERHIEIECPLTLVECEFRHCGCEAKVLRKTISDHLKDDIVTHFSLLAENQRKQQAEIKEINKRQQDEIKGLTEEVDKLKLKIRQLKLHTLIVPVDLMVEKPQQFLTSLFEWSSMPFYSHSQGYKLRIGICYDVWTGRYFIRTYLMQGEFDDLLKWPLNAIITIHVLTQGSKDLERRIKLHNKNRVKIGGSEVYCETDITKNLTPYMCNNCLHIRISSVRLI